MAGRGTDIKLPQEVKDAGGLHVIILDTLDTVTNVSSMGGQAPIDPEAGHRQFIGRT